MNSALSSLLNMSTMITPAATAARSGVASTPIGKTDGTIPSYAEGGMVGPNGVPVIPKVPGMQSQGPGVATGGMGGQAPMGPQQMELEARRFVQQNPQQVAEIRENMMEALQEGAITPDQITTMTQMAKVALQNPEMYPQLRAMLIQRGVVEEEDLSPEFDQGMLFILIVIGEVMRSAPVGGAPAEGAATPPLPAPGAAGPTSAPSGTPSFAKGGPIPDSKKADGSMIIKAHEGEYVVPKDVAQYLGLKTLQGMVQKARDDMNGVEKPKSA